LSLFVPHPQIVPQHKYLLITQSIHIHLILSKKDSQETTEIPGIII